MQRRSTRVPISQQRHIRTKHTRSVVGLPSIGASGLERLRTSKILDSSVQRSTELRKYFYFDSQDEYIRRILLDNGWVQCRSDQIRQVQLAWVYNPDKLSSQLARTAAKINHFANSHVLTTKDGLRVTLYNHAPSHIKASSFYPRTYDLHSQIEDFEADFSRTALLNLLKKYMVYIETSNIVVERSNQTLEDLLRKGWEGVVSTDTNANLLFPRTMLLHSIIWFQTLKDKLEIGSSCSQFQYKITSHIEKQLIEFSRVDPPYHLSKQAEQWITPTSHCIQLIQKYARFFERHYPSYRSDGFCNIWVVKPSQSSKGRNLYLLDSMQQVKRHIQSCRIIQKYVENIWVFTQRELDHYKDTTIKGELRRLLNKKFDIRLWVLVTSFHPLVVYLHDEAYLRLASGNYCFDSLNNHYEHLTNYSVNKHKLCQDDSYVLFSVLEQHLQSVYGYSRLRTDIQSLVVDTLQCAQNQIQSHPSSFEFYGFDVILDCDLKPWLLEVNMSPACKERGELKDLLAEMGQGILNIAGVLSTAKHDHQWRLIYTEPQPPVPERARVDLGLSGKSLTMSEFDTHQHFTQKIEALTLIQRFVKARKGQSPATKNNSIPRAMHLVSVIAHTIRLARKRMAFIAIAGAKPSRRTATRYRHSAIQRKQVKAR